MSSEAIIEHNESTLTRAILNNWPAEGNQYIVAVQVHNSAGFSARRRLDAVVFDTWPSKGLAIHGLEVKCTAADFRTELRDTNKMADFSAHLDTFSIVAPKGVVKKELLHDRWGLYCPTDDGKLKAVKRPLYLHDQGQRKEINRSFAAAFIRALVTRSISQEGLNDAYAKGHAAGKGEAENNNRYELPRVTAALETLRGAAKAFEEQSGIRIDRYAGPNIGVAAKFVLSGGLQHRLKYSGDIREMANKMSQFADELERLNALVDLDKIEAAL